MAKIHFEHRGDKLKIYYALKTIVKKLSAISQATWSIHNQCSLLKRSGSCITAAWWWWKRMQRKRHCAPNFVLHLHHDTERYWNKTEFSRKVHNSVLYRPSLTLRGAFWKCRFKPEGTFDLLYFLAFFSFCLSLLICQSVWPHTDICVCKLQLIQYTMTVLSTQRETLISAPTPWPSPAKQSKSGRSWTERKEEIALI